MTTINEARLTDEELPALPRADYYESTAVPEDTPLYTAEQMRAYACKAIENLRNQKPVAWIEVSKDDEQELVWCRDEELDGLLYSYEPLFAAPVPGGRDAIAAAVCREVAELPYRNSPEDWPEAMLVTHEELHQIVLAALASQDGNKEQQG